MNSIFSMLSEVLFFHKRKGFFARFLLGIVVTALVTTIEIGQANALADEFDETTTPPPADSVGVDFTPPPPPSLDTIYTVQPQIIQDGARILVGWYQQVNDMLQQLNAKQYSDGNNNIGIGTNNFTTTNLVHLGSNNVAIGNGALGSIELSDTNIAIGNNSLSSSTNTHYNIAIGNGTLAGLTSGALNIVIGNGSVPYSPMALGNIVIGNNLYLENPSDMFTLNIGNIIYGTDIGEYDLYNAKIGIGVRHPQERLSVNGSIQSLEGGFVFPDGSRQSTAWMPGSILKIGFVDIGCKLSNEGVIRYNSAAKAFEGCNGTTWTQF